MHDLACHTTSLRALQKGAGKHSDKRSDHHRNTKHCRKGRGNSASNINIVETEGMSSTSMETLTPNPSALMQVRYIQQSMSTPGTPRTNGSRATYVDSAPFCKVFLENSELQAQCPLIPSQLKQRFATQREKNLKHLPSRPQKRLKHEQARTQN